MIPPSKPPGMLGPADLTPESASPTDIAPIGRAEAKPAHELTAAEEVAAADWRAIAQDAEFLALLRSKARFIIPATVFFTLYYFLLPVAVGWFPEFMARRVVGSANLAYLFALSQFLMAWVLAFLYVMAASGWDQRAAALIRRFFAAKGEGI